MAGVNWQGTEKVMDTSTVTLSLYLMVSYKILCHLGATTPAVQINEIYKLIDKLDKPDR